MKSPAFLRSSCLIGLSPMDGITDEPFRRTVCHLAKPDLVFTEFVSAEGLTKGGVKLYDKLLFSKEERPIIGQLFGKDPASFHHAAYVLTGLGFDGIDINLGCPAKKVIHHGSGAALIGQHDLVGDIISQTKQGIADFFSHPHDYRSLGLNDKTQKAIIRNLAYAGLPPDHLPACRPSVSVKTRLGIDQDISASWLPFLLSHRLDFITLHGRTLKQGYAGLADWESIARSAVFAHQNQTLLLGNGDVQNRLQALELCRRFGADGALIGRFALGSPWIFGDNLPSPQDRFSAMLLHAQYFKQCFPSRRLDSLRRHFLSYVSGLKTAKQLRSQIVTISDFDQLLSLEPAILNC